MRIEHRILIFFAMPAESSNSHGGRKIVLFAIFQVSLYIPSSMDLPQRRSPAQESRMFTRLRCNFSGSASSYPVENSRYTAMLLNEEAVLVSLRVSLTGDTITGDLER